VGLPSFPDGSGEVFPQDLTQYPQPLVPISHEPSSLVVSLTIDEPSNQPTLTVEEVKVISPGRLNPTDDLSSLVTNCDQLGP
jgi:hypothetical protein